MASTTALEIARRLPPLPSKADSMFDKWDDSFYTGTHSTENVLSFAYRFWTARVEGDFLGHQSPDGVELTLWVYDSPAARLETEQQRPARYDSTAGSHVNHRYRCVADCGAVALEADGSDDPESRGWVNDAVTTYQAGLKSIFGACPASDDVAANPPTVGTWPPFSSTTTLRR